MRIKLPLTLVLDGVNPEAELAFLRKRVRDELEGYLMDGCVIEAVDFGSAVVGVDP